MSRSPMPSDGKGPRWLGDDLPSPPASLTYAQSLPPVVTSTHVLFFGFEGPEPECALQQWYPSSFTATDPQTQATDTFHTAEQYMMYHKALLMGDDEIAVETLSCKTPAEAKALGRKVRNFDQAKWDAAMDRIVEEGNYLKFSQDTRLQQILLGTEDRMLVETSPNDRLWGIGFDSETALEHKDEWGENKLGKALMRVRDSLRDRPLLVN